MRTFTVASRTNYSDFFQWMNHLQIMQALQHTKSSYFKTKQKSGQHKQSHQINSGTTFTAVYARKVNRSFLRPLMTPGSLTEKFVGKGHVL